MKKILISSGGSGGHINPSIALYSHLKEKYYVKIITDQRGARYLAKSSCKFEIIDVPNIFNNLLKLPINIFKNIISFFQSYIYLKKNNFDILISTGGYMSIPLFLSAKFLKKEVFLYEPNTTLGRANRFMINYSKKIFCITNKINNLPKKFENKIFVIEPLLRKEIYEIEKNNQNKISNPLKIIILGGSQGANFFDNKLHNVIKNLSNNFNIELIQQVQDKETVEILKKFYDKLNIENNIFTFDEDIFNKINQCNLAITRSGASALAELCMINTPFIAIPFPHAKDNHQLLNAKYYEKKGACWVVEQSDFEIDKMTNLFIKIFENQSEYLKKKENLYKISYQNSWNNINQKLIKILNDKIS
mgnify:CR=1 FL=1